MYSGVSRLDAAVQILNQPDALYPQVLSTASCVTYAACRAQYKKKRGIKGWAI